jgi:HEAT repeat protein
VPTHVQKKAIFALSQLPDERSIPVLRALVESDRPRAIRKEAMFWLAQQDSPEAFAVFDRIFGK